MGARTHAEAPHPLVARVRAALRLAALLVVLLILADAVIDTERLHRLLPFKLASLALALVSLVTFPRWRTRHRAVRVVLANISAGLLLTALAASAVGDDASTALLATVLVLLSATFMPWGLAPHGVVLGAAVAATTLNLLLVHGRIPVEQAERLVVIAAIWLWSIYPTRKLARSRARVSHEEAERRRAEEARENEGLIAAALARVGQELMESLRTDELLLRLCRTTTELLGCDFSHTWLWDTRSDAIVPVAGFGDPPEIWAAIRECRIPREGSVQGDLAELLASGTAGQLVLERPGEGPATPPGLRPVIYGLTVLLCVPLRRGHEILGAHIAGYRGHDTAFTPVQERILDGIGGLASLALEYTLTLRQLEDANRLKSEFVANMSHELRTPINVIRGYVDLALCGDYGDLPHELLADLRKVEERAADLQELVDATLDLGHLDTGRLPVERRRVAVDEFRQAVEDATQRLRAASPVGFTWRVEDGLEAMFVDPDKLGIVARNLLSNAFKFTPSGTIAVEVRRRSGGVELTVRDTGPGIPPELREEIFEPFHQGDGSSTRTAGGTGLGLHVCRRLLEVMGGSISVESEVGRGSTFRVWVPAETSGGDRDGW